MEKTTKNPDIEAEALIRNIRRNGPTSQAESDLFKCLNQINESSRGDLALNFMLSVGQRIPEKMFKINLDYEFECFREDKPGRHLLPGHFMAYVSGVSPNLKPNYPQDSPKNERIALQATAKIASALRKGMDKTRD
jgi:hypothetical protein